jgi:hypothetical protein
VGRAVIGEIGQPLGGLRIVKRGSATELTLLPLELVQALLHLAQCAESLAELLRDLHDILGRRHPIVEPVDPRSLIPHLEGIVRGLVFEELASHQIHGLMGEHLLSRRNWSSFLARGEHVLH